MCVCRWGSKAWQGWAELASASPLASCPHLPAKLACCLAPLYPSVGRSAAAKSNPSLLPPRHMLCHAPLTLFISQQLVKPCSSLASLVVSPQQHCAPQRTCTSHAVEALLSTAVSPSPQHTHRRSSCELNGTIACCGAAAVLDAPQRAAMPAKLETSEGGGESLVLAIRLLCTGGVFRF